MNPARHPAVLLVDGDTALLDTMEDVLQDEFQVYRAETASKALEVLNDEWIQVTICDHTLPGSNGIDLLADVDSRWPETVNILISGADGVDEIARRGTGQEIYHHLVKPWKPEQLLRAARNGAERFRLQRENERLSLEMKQFAGVRDRTVVRRRADINPGFGFDRIIRHPGAALDRLCETAAQVASFDVPALIIGETGTGKELLARAIHYGSLRSEQPFHAVNCGAIPDELLESELFGHKKGSFTGAHVNRLGLLEQADGGTVFLDEIGDTSPAFQVKLLRFLQEGEIRPVGSNDTLTVDVRIIAATNRNLEDEARSGIFREDLYYRLAVCPLRIPPLRDRAQDIPSLTDYILGKAMDQHGKRVKGIEQDALDALCRYGWPGNVRELENEITRMLMITLSDRITAADVAPRILRTCTARKEEDPAAEAALIIDGTLKDRVERMEARVLRETLTRLRWNKSRAADELGLSRVGLRAKLDRYGIEEPGRGAEAPAGEEELRAAE